MSGGAEFVDVIPSFGGHIAHVLWSNPDGGRPVLMGYLRENKLPELVKWPMLPDARSLVARSGLLHLGECMVKHINMPLLSAFVERWQPDTNTFHLPFGEMTILLHDVEEILGIPIEGKVCGLSDVDNAYLCVFFGMSMEELKMPFKTTTKAPRYKGGAVLVDAVESVMNGRNVEEQAQGYLFLLLGMSLFVDKSSDRVKSMVFPLLEEINNVPGYAWGIGALAYMYRELGIASRAGSRGLAGYMTLLQVWIYEYFPCFRPAQPSALGDGLPRAMGWVDIPRFEGGNTLLATYRQQLDGLTVQSVRWLPYGHRPN
ncbi:hypothetical protein vseg_008029 [Gypsophila vaccaria]